MRYTVLESSYKLTRPGSVPALLPLPADGAAQLGQMPEYDQDRVMGRKTRHLSAATLFFASTARPLLDHRHIKSVRENDSSRIGVYVAAETITLHDDLSFELTIKSHGPDYVSPLLAPNTLANVVGSHFATFAEINGPNCTVSSGQSGGIHSLQLAAFGIDEGAIDCAIVGGVEVASESHQVVFPGSRETAVVHAVAASNGNDSVAFGTPNIFMAGGNAPAQELSRRLKDEALAHFGDVRLDAVLLAFGSHTVDGGALLSALSEAGVSDALLVCERLYGHGESCSGLLALGVGKELLGGAPVGEAPAWQDGQAPGRIKRLGIVGIDEYLQGVALVMAARHEA